MINLLASIINKLMMYLIEFIIMFNNSFPISQRNLFTLYVGSLLSWLLCSFALCQ